MTIECLNTEVIPVKIKFFTVICFIMFCLLACGTNGADHSIDSTISNPTPEPTELFSQSVEPIVKTNQIYTSAKQLSLTFSGLPSREKLEEVLELLDKHKIQATFFVTGQRAAIEPELIQLIEVHGHEVENHTLSKKSMEGYTYDQIYNELALGKHTIEAASQRKVKYVRTETSTFELPILKAANQTEHERYIGYSFYITDESLNTKFKESKDMRLYINRGAIIAIDLERSNKIAEMLKLLVPAVEEVGYQFVTVERLIESELEKKPYEDIPGYDLAQKHTVAVDQPYHAFEKIETNEKVISITIDDWGTDYTVTKMLNILNEKAVKATFFIRANGAENNPSLARAILDEGHEIANHTYSHPVITKITAEELQEELVRSHHILTEALQQPPAMYFRPPTGEIDDTTAKIVAATGYNQIALYNITTLDWDINTKADDIVRIITDEATNGSIVLLHMLDDIHTLEALPIVIDRLREQGFDFVTITELLQLDETEGENND